VQAIAAGLCAAVVRSGSLAPVTSSTARQGVAPVARPVPDPLFVETVVLDGMWRVADDGTGGRRYRIAWFDPPFRPPLEAATQALGICLTGDRRVVLVTWDGQQWSLPGGSLEAGETVERALRRASWARVELDEFRSDHEMTARRLVAPEEFRATLFWGAEVTAGLILERGLAIESGESYRRA
jgi:hypothetical protein